MPPSDCGPRPKFVVVVVLTWNDTIMTTQCIESVLASDYANYKVLLVDNGSAEPCGERVRERFPAIELLSLPVNQGFAGGGNRGIELALEMGAEYVHLIGNDSTLAPDAISKLVDALDADATLCAASPLILSQDEEPTVQFYRAEVHRDGAKHFHYDHHVPLAGREWPSRESPFIPFVAMLFRRAALEQVGLMDESYCTSWEDYDLCLRLTDAGWRMVVVGESHAFHRVHGTTGKYSPYITYYMIRNRLICLARYGRPFKSPSNTLWLARSLVGQVKAYGFSNWTCHWAFARGIFDYLIGVRGVGHPPSSREG